MSDGTLDPLPEERPLKVTVTVLVPYETMKWADEYAKRAGMNRGQVVTEALEGLRSFEEPGR